MDVFNLTNSVVDEYRRYVSSFLNIRDPRVQERVEEELNSGLLWPRPMLQLNPAFEAGDPIQQLIDADVLHPTCEPIFRVKPAADDKGEPLRLHRHQVEAIHRARAGRSYVLTTGTGSGKSLSYIVPIVDHVLRSGSGQGVQAIVVYPMNALANSQVRELSRFLVHGFPAGQSPVTFACYTGQESDERRESIRRNPPDILLTNYVMLELILTRGIEAPLVAAFRPLRFLVFDELHTYRGRQGADVALLIRRTRQCSASPSVQCVGTSATLASAPTWREQQVEVADLATTMFGQPVSPDDVIGETLRRITLPTTPDPAFASALTRSVLTPEPIESASALRQEPLARWLEEHLGLREEDNRLVRQPPRPLAGREGLAEELASEVGLPTEACAERIQHVLMAGARLHDERGRPLLAFRLHQFLSKGERVYATPEPEGERAISLSGQVWLPGSGGQRLLLPLAFCRECGQDYAVARRATGPSLHLDRRELEEQGSADDDRSGFLFFCEDAPWAHLDVFPIDLLPDAWKEPRKDGSWRIRKDRQGRIPRRVRVTPAGILESEGPHNAWWMRAPFLFCPRCGVTYDARQRKDFGKLATLGTEGRASATTLLTLSSVRTLRKTDVDPKAKKILSFTDNRQDASLQAGHFNDFVEVGLLRSALVRALTLAGPVGLAYDQVVDAVVQALQLPFSAYALNPDARFRRAREEAEGALRGVVEYYLYRDLQRGWRLTSPNLEQCGLLRFDYADLHEFCATQEIWADLGDALARATPAVRERVCRALLDHLRRELAVRVDVLEEGPQTVLRQRAWQNLNGDWRFDETEWLERSRVAWPRRRDDDDRTSDRGVFVSAWSGFGLYLGRPDVLPDAAKLSRAEREALIPELFLRLARDAAILEPVEDAREHGGPPGYQLAARALRWLPGDGTSGHHDPIRVPNPPEGGLRTNSWFVNFYRQDLADLRDMEGREHTAQVTDADRREREERFSEATLPVLFCSPTMELGVDIAQLNAVHLRNVPPTPASYAQRSGRAGRSGQPALVLTYCTVGSPHDQYFYRRPDRMVRGVVTTPRLDLANEDLIRAHIHAIWLSASGLELHASLRHTLDLDGDPPTLQPRPHVLDAMQDRGVRERALQLAVAALRRPVEELLGGEGRPEDWIQRALDDLPARFNRATERWCALYRASYTASQKYAKAVLDHSLSSREHERMLRMRQQAEQQLRLLLNDADAQSDFYPYRYLASEGFLPGYNFPRLPLSAFLHGRRRPARGAGEEHVQRPRFLAISEFGPRGVVYHEGTQYQIHKVILPAREPDADLTRKMRRCPACGYLHEVDDAQDPDRCQRCDHTPLTTLSRLFLMRNVEARRRDRIHCDEEERMRLGYEVRTSVRFAPRETGTAVRSGTLRDLQGVPLATLEYSPAATLTRMNLRERRAGEDTPDGYELDVETGWWARSRTEDEDAQEGGPQLVEEARRRVERVIPYVEDRRNCLLLTPSSSPSDPDERNAWMASLTAAVKSSIQSTFQVEDSELSAEPLPDEHDRRLILLYESSEGGAGVLRRLVDEPGALASVAQAALERLHFDPRNGDDLGGVEGVRDRCEIACYDCLLSYYNQRDHRRLSRHLLRDVLLAWRTGQVHSSPALRTRGEHLVALGVACTSDMERRFLHYLHEGGYHLPSQVRRRFQEPAVEADFYYDEQRVALFLDGTSRDDPAVRRRDEALALDLLDAGVQVIRVGHDADWGAIVRTFPSVFGPGWRRP